MKIFRRQLIYVQVHQSRFIAHVVGGDRIIRRQCHTLGNRARIIKDFGVSSPDCHCIMVEHKN